MIRKHRFALTLLFVLAAVLFVAPLAKREVFVVRDHFDYFQPLRWFTATELLAGRLPLWNPYNASGEPWMANPQTGVFYPPAWLFLALPFDTAYMLFLFAHLLLLGWGAYLLFARGATPGAAMVGAAALIFSGPVLSLLDVSNNLATLAWIPLALWCAATGAWKRGGVVLALAFLGGEPFFAAVAALLYVIVRRHRDVLGTALIAFGLSAVQLLPFLEMVRGSDRAGGMEDVLVLRDSAPLRDWLRVAIPPNAFDTPQAQQFIPLLYGGVVIAALALLGLTTLRRRRDALGWLLLLVVAVFVSTGPAFLAKLPVTLFRYPSRLVPFGMLALCALAVIGWERVRRDRRWIDLVLVLIVVVDLLPRAKPLLVTAPFRTSVVPYAKELGAEQKLLRIGDIDAQRRAWIAGYLNLYDRRFDADTAAPLASKAYLELHAELRRAPRRELLDAAAIGHVLTARELALPFEKVARVSSVNAYAVPQSRAMAVHVSRAGVMPVRCEITTSRVRASVGARESGMLLLAQQDAAGWSVTVDGKPSVSRRFSGVFRAVEVPRGEHEVVWSYRPRAFFAGGAITLVTLLAGQLFWFVKRRR